MIGNSCDLDSSRRQLDKEKDKETFQPAGRPHLDGEKVTRDNLIPMPVEELLPRRLSAPFRSRFNSMASQNARDCIVCEPMSQIRQGSLNPPIAPILIFLCHPSHEFCNLGGGLRPSRTALSAPIV